MPKDKTQGVASASVLLVATLATGFLHSCWYHWLQGAAWCTAEKCLEMHVYGKLRCVAAGCTYVQYLCCCVVVGAGLNEVARVGCVLCLFSLRFLTVFVVDVCARLASGGCCPLQCCYLLNGMLTVRCMCTCVCQSKAFSKLFPVLLPCVASLVVTAACWACRWLCRSNK